jgi:hypothetical protein
MRKLPEANEDWQWSDETASLHIRAQRLTGRTAPSDCGTLFCFCFCTFINGRHLRSVLVFDCWTVITRLVYLTCELLHRHEFSGIPGHGIAGQSICLC